MVDVEKPLMFSCRNEDKECCGCHTVSEFDGVDFFKSQMENSSRQMVYGNYMRTIGCGDRA